MNGNTDFSALGDFHHVGIAVKDFRKPLKYHEKLGYVPTHSSEVRDELQKVELYMLNHPTFPDVELVKPYDDESPLQNYLKDGEPRMYHFCYEVDSFDAAAEFLKKGNRIFCVAPPKPAILFDNRRVTFYNVHGVGLVELLERETA